MVYSAVLHITSKYTPAIRDYYGVSSRPVIIFIIISLYAPCIYIYYIPTAVGRSAAAAAAAIYTAPAQRALSCPSAKTRGGVWRGVIAAR